MAILVGMFPGQGSQKVGMGEGLFDLFSKEVKAIDDFLGYSIKELCTQDPNNVLNQTCYTQVALYVVSALEFLKKQKENNRNFDYFIGHSLGEYNALFASGAFDLMTGLALVQKRGELMFKVKKGSMAAVIGLEEKTIQSVLQEYSNKGIIEIANHNSLNQIVISGDKALIEILAPVFTEKGAKRYIPLNVSGAFHSSYMKQAAKEYATFLESISIVFPKIPVIANVDAKPYENNLISIKKKLVEQISHPVLWVQSILDLKNKGECFFEEIGQGNVLTGLVKRI